MTTRLALLLTGLMVVSAATAHGVFDARMQALDEAIRLTPGDATLYLRRGVASREHGDWNAALHDFRTAAKLTAAGSEARILIAATLHDAGQVQQAVDKLDEIIAATPANSDALLERARSLETQRRWLAAAADLGTAIAVMDPLVPEVILTRAKVLQSAGPEHMAAAIATLENGIAQLGPVASLVRRLADLAMNETHFAAGLAALDQLPAAVQSRPNWLQRRAGLLSAGGEVAAARDAYQAALAGLQSIPATRRATRAMTALEAELISQLEALQ